MDEHNNPQINIEVPEANGKLANSEETTAIDVELSDPKDANNATTPDCPKPVPNEELSNVTDSPKPVADKELCQLSPVSVSVENGLSEYGQEDSDCEDEFLKTMDLASSLGDVSRRDSVLDLNNSRLRAESVMVPLEINRRAYNQRRFDKEFGWNERDEYGDYKRWFKTQCTWSVSRLVQTVVQFIPVLQWLPKYSPKRSLLKDGTSGFTVGVLNIPQGMAYATLARMPPICGLYTSFFPPLIYMFLGTSSHISIGTFAVMSLMVGQVVNSHPSHAIALQSYNSTDRTLNSLFTYEEQASIDIASSLTLMVGVILMVMGMLRVGFIAAYLSDQVVGGFTTAAACFVFTSQLGSIFGLSVAKHNGFLAFFKIYIDFFSKISSINWATVIMSAVTIICLSIGKEIINPRVTKRIKIPVPWELVAVIIGTFVSAIFSLNENFDITQVGAVPSGLPPMNIPKLSLMPDMIVDAFVISFMVFVISVSVGKLFAKKHHYAIDTAQEPYAYGLSNIVVSLFSGHVASASLSRSQLLSELDSKTPLHALFNCVIVLVVLLFVGPLLFWLPKCVLASIIVVALKGMFKQFNQLKPLWHVSKIDFLIWIVSFVATIVFDVRIGLAMSILFALFTSIVQSQWPPAVLLGQLPNTDIYHNINRYKKVTGSIRIFTAEEISCVKVFRFDSPLMFTNSELFRLQLLAKCGVDLNAARRAIGEAKEKQNGVAADSKPNTPKPTLPRSLKGANRISHVTGPVPIKQMPTTSRPRPADLNLPDFIVLDCSGFNYIDYMGVNVLMEVFSELSDIGVMLLYARLKGPVRDKLESADFYKKVPKSSLFPSVHDAVTYGLFHKNDGVLFAGLNSPQSSSGKLK